MRSAASPRPLWIACLALAACRADPAPGQEGRDPSDLRPLVVASDLDNPPFASVDADGRPRGRDVEMMELLARALDRSVVWRRMAFAALLDSAEAGEVDLVCATIGITPERAERVRFSQPYYETEIAVVARSGAREPRSLADLAGRRVAAGAGTTSELALLKHLPQAIPVLDDKAVGTTRERLLAREIDAVLLDGPSADALVAPSRSELVRLPEAVAVERYALVLPKDRVELASAVDRALERLRSQGVLARLDREHALMPSGPQTGR